MSGSSNLLRLSMVLRKPVELFDDFGYLSGKNSELLDTLLLLIPEPASTPSIRAKPLPVV